MTANSEEIDHRVEQMDQEANMIRANCLKISWSLRGGLSYEQALNLSPEERKMVNELIKENYEATKKSGLPHF